MKKSLFYLLITATGILNFSGTTKSALIKTVELKNRNFSPKCAPYYEINSSSSNTITEIHISRAGSSTIYYNPTFPFGFYDVSPITILVRFAPGSGIGGLRSYHQVSGEWILIGCETYDPQYENPVIINGGGCGSQFRFNITDLECD
ncbi:MAG: hypothetical protein H0W75_04890 [Chitinophagaceae bacterium]|nr:hypothetical protein [Chitinophagaceae bacterium]